MSFTVDQLQAVLDRGGEVHDAAGERVGGAGQVYADDATGEPTFVTVKTGLLGTGSSFVPLQGARLEGDRIVVAYARSQISDAPRPDDDGRISPEEEQQLFAYYGLGQGTAGQRREAPGLEGDRSPVDVARAGTAGTGGTGTDTAMTRSEERFRVGKQVRVTGRVRVRKYIVTENVTQTFQVRREEVRLEEEAGAERGAGELVSDEPFTGSQLEIVLHEERPAVQLSVVPVERVRVVKDVVTRQVNVSEQLRREEIATEGDLGRRGQ